MYYTTQPDVMTVLLAIIRDLEAQGFRVRVSFTAPSVKA